MLQILGASFLHATYTDRPWWRHREPRAWPEPREPATCLPRLRPACRGAHC